MTADRDEGGVPDWLADPELRPVWERVRDRFEGTGLQPTGRVRVTAASRAQRHALGALLGRTVTRERVTVDLSRLDHRLRERSGLGGLDAVLAAVLGAPPRDRPAARAAERRAREQPLALATELVRAPWAEEWVARLRRQGVLTGRPDAERVVRDAARVLEVLTDDIDPGSRRDRQTANMRSRVELGARLLGDAHALDMDRVLHRVIVHGLAAAAGTASPDGARARDGLWARFGVAPDLLSRTCLVWRLRLEGDGAVARRLRLAHEDGDPVHLTDWDLRRAATFTPVTDEPVLVCENPRVLEALAERAVDGWTVVCTSGEPNLVVGSVLQALVEAGATLYYHGDFDWPGIAIANRVMDRFGAVPWHMDSEDYVGGVRADGPELQGDPIEPGWSAELGAAMRTHGRAVHEESVMHGLTADPDPWWHPRTAHAERGTQTTVVATYGRDMSRAPLPHEDVEFVLARRRWRTPVVAELTLQVVEEEITFVPGQHVMLQDAQHRVPVQDYSMANAPRDDGSLTFLVTHLPGPDEPTSHWLTKGARPGDRVLVSGPSGDFVTDPAHRGPTLYLAGGSGLAPARSLIEGAVAGGDTAHVDPERRHTLLFSARTSEDLIDHERLTTLADEQPGFDYVRTLTRVAEADAEAPLGRVPEVLPSLLPDLSDHAVYISGGTGFVDACTRTAQDLGVRPERLHTEEFYPEDIPWHGNPDQA